MPDALVEFIKGECKEPSPKYWRNNKKRSTAFILADCQSPPDGHGESAKLKVSSTPSQFAKSNWMVVLLKKATPKQSGVIGCSTASRTRTSF